jgi:hypothetical protein
MLPSVNRRSMMMPVTCGRTSAIWLATVRPDNSVETGTAVGVATI